MSTPKPGCTHDDSFERMLEGLGLVTTAIIPGVVRLNRSAVQMRKALRGLEALLETRRGLSEFETQILLDKIEAQVQSALGGALV